DVRMSPFRPPKIGCSCIAHSARSGRGRGQRSATPSHSGTASRVRHEPAVAGTRLARTERTSVGKTPPTAMLVISDGAQRSGRTTPAAAATQARSLHIPVYTVVIGTQDGVVNVPLAGGFNAQLRVPPDPETLR